MPKRLLQKRGQACALLIPQRISIIAMAAAHVVVRLLSGEEYVFSIDNDSSVLDLKRQLKRQIGVPKAAMSILLKDNASILSDGDALINFSTTAPWFKIADLVPLREQPLHAEFDAVLRYPECSKCGKIKDVISFLRCGRCYATEYCSKKCQTEDWREHKQTCCRRAACR